MPIIHFPCPGDPVRDLLPPRDQVFDLLTSDKAKTLPSYSSAFSNAISYLKDNPAVKDINVIVRYRNEFKLVRFYRNPLPGTRGDIKSFIIWHF